MWANNEKFGPPRETFSVYQALRTGEPKINGRILLQDQGCPVVKSDSLLVTGGYGQHKEQPWPILWSEHAGARLEDLTKMPSPGPRLSFQGCDDWIPRKEFHATTEHGLRGMTS
jgi:hypothetical protein